MSFPVEQFVERLSDSGLMFAAEIVAFQESLPLEKRPDDGWALAASLVQAGKLTEYQAQAICDGQIEGLVFDAYVVLDKIGQGGMGVVLKALHRTMDRVVAVKVLPTEIMNASEAVARFYAEMKAAAKLSHTNIVAAYDAGQNQGMHYLVMEYVDGRDLASIVKERGALPVRQAMEYILQTARGLHYAHRHGIVHRDIKPGNLLVNREGVVKIIDTGLALLTELEAASGGEDTTGQSMGTHEYMAPEQSLDAHKADPRSDIYALGCTLYRLATGELPYRAKTNAELFLMHLESPIPSICEVRPEAPAALDVLFARMVAKKPEERCQSMAEVLAQLDICLGRPARSVALPDHASAEKAVHTAEDRGSVLSVNPLLNPPNKWTNTNGGGVRFASNNAVPDGNPPAPPTTPPSLAPSAVVAGPAGTAEAETASPAATVDPRTPSQPPGDSTPADSAAPSAVEGTRTAVDAVHASNHDWVATAWNDQWIPSWPLMAKRHGDISKTHPQFPADAASPDDSLDGTDRVSPPS